MTREVNRVLLEKCTGDGVCVEVCPHDVIEIHEGKARTVPGRDPLCISCGQCAAVCPTGAMQLADMPQESFEKLRPWKLAYDDFTAFLASRRSVRVFKKEPVDRALVNKVIEAASMAPMGFPPHTTEILVIDRREELDHLLEVVRSNYDKLVKMWANPVMRGVIRLKRGARIAHSLRTHVMSIVQDNNERFRLSGEDRYTYSAPVLMLFHANQWAVSFEENAMLVASYAMLGAHALGLGATLLSIIPPAVNNFKDLRLRYDMPDDNVVVTSMILGYPKYKYRLGVRRRLRNVKFV